MAVVQHPMNHKGQLNQIFVCSSINMAMYSLTYIDGLVSDY